MVCFFFFFLFTDAARRGSVRLHHFVIFLALAVIVNLGVQIYQSVALADPRPAGLFFNPNFLGELMSISSVVFLGSAVLGKGEARVKWVYVLFFLLCLISLFLTGSRGSAISCVAGNALILFFRFRWKAFAVILLVLLLFAVTPNPLRERVVSKADVYRYSRLGIYDAGLKVVSDHPLGIGLGNFKYYYDQYESPVTGAVSLYGKKAKTLHNEHLQVFVEQGFVGMLLYLGFVISLLVRLILPPRAVHDPLRAIVYGTGISFIVHATVDSLYHTFALPLVMFSIVGFSIAECETQWAEVITRKSMRAFLALLATAAISYSAATVSSFYLSTLAQRRAREGKFDPALKLACAATTLDFLNGKASETKGALHYRTFMKSNDQIHFRKAILEIERSMCLEKRSGSLRGRKAFLLRTGMEKGLFLNEEVVIRRKEAIRLYVEQLSIEPYNVFAMRNLSILLAGSGRGGEAEWFLKKAISTEPNFAGGYYLLGKMREERGMSEEARFLYKMAFSIYKKYSGLKGLETYAEKLIMLDDQALNDIRVKIDERI